MKMDNFGKESVIDIKVDFAWYRKTVFLFELILGSFFFSRLWNCLSTCNIFLMIIVFKENRGNYHAYSHNDFVSTIFITPPLLIH